MVTLVQQDGAQGGGQRQRGKTRDHHRNGDGHGELLIELPGNTTEESNRDEHRTQHQHNRHDGAGYFAHRLDCGFLGLHALLAHKALNVLQHYDGVVNDDAYGQDHREQGQRVD